METWWTMPSKGATSLSLKGEDSCRRDATRDDGCAYTTLIKTICSLDKDASGRPVQKCEKTEQLLRKCAGRPAELVDSKVEATEEDASTSHYPFSVDHDSSAARGFPTPNPWHERRYGPGGEAASGEYPLRGLFERRDRAFPGSLEEIAQDVFGAPFQFPEEAERAVPPSAAPGTSEHLFGWFNRGSFGNSQNSPANDASSRDQLNPNPEVAKLYESFARGIQEV